MKFAPCTLHAVHEFHYSSKIQIARELAAQIFVRHFAVQNSNQSVSQSVSQACTPRGEPALNFHFIIHTLHAHWLQKSKQPFNCCFHTSVLRSVLPATQSLVATIHLQFCCPIGVLAAQTALAPQVANAKPSVSNDEWEVWQCEQPVSNTHHSKFGTNSVSLRCQQNVLHARSKRAKPVCGGGPTMDRQNLRKWRSKVCICSL